MFCHAGCRTDSVLREVELPWNALLPSSKVPRQRADERAIYRAADPERKRVLVREAIQRGLEQTRERLRSELGYDRPLRSSDVNAVRSHVASIYESQLEPIAPYPWEGWAPHDTDQLWPILFERGLREVLIVKYGDPDVESTDGERHVAAVWAARDLHAIARACGAA